MRVHDDKIKLEVSLVFVSAVAACEALDSISKPLLRVT